MPSTRELHHLVDLLPNEKQKLARLFLDWLRKEDFTPTEIEHIIEGEKALAKGEVVRWREIARTI